MLDLGSERWRLLETAYGTAEPIVDALRDLGDDPEDPDAWEELWSSLCHQYSIYTATYAAIPHIVLLAGKWNGQALVNAVSFVGTCVACKRLPDTSDVPHDLSSDYEQALQHLPELALRALSSAALDEEEHRALFAALAAVRGFAGLAFVLMDLDSSIECQQCGAFIEPMESNLNLLHESS